MYWLFDLVSFWMSSKAEEVDQSLDENGNGATVLK
jgi:hypothetical protein